MVRITPETKAQWRGVLVVSEHHAGVLKPITRELLPKGRDLADTLQVKLSCAILGDKLGALPKEAIALGADRVFAISSPALVPYGVEPHAEALAPLIALERPEVVLLGSTRNGRDLAGRLAVRLGTGIGADSQEIVVDMTTRNIEMIKSAFGGLVLAAIVSENFRPQIATARPNVFQPHRPDWTRAGEIVRLPYTPSRARPRSRVLEERRTGSSAVRIEDTKSIICVGRGIGSPERVEAAAELARLIGGELGGTRPVADLGWIPKKKMIGQTGAFVRPKLYLGLGVSGQAAHTIGFVGTPTVAAVNKDPKAPIFAMADIAVEGDIAEILPALLDEMRKRLASKGEAAQASGEGAKAPAG